MANNKAMLILRGAKDYKPHESTEELLDGQLFYSKCNKLLYIGDNVNYKDPANNNKTTINITKPIGAANLIPGEGVRSVKSLNSSPDDAAGITDYFTFGAGTEAAKSNLTVVGEYNIQKEDALFIVGNGNGIVDSDGYRKNAFEVLKDGSTNILKDLNILSPSNSEKKASICYDDSLDALVFGFPPINT